MKSKYFDELHEIDELNFIKSYDYELPQSTDLYADAAMAINSKNIQAIKKVLNSTRYYNQYNQEKIEQIVFHSAFLSVDSDASDLALKYLIFDYQINESNSIDTMSNIEKKYSVQKMFEARNLKNKLNEELDNKETNSRRLKV